MALLAAHSAKAQDNYPIQIPGEFGGYTTDSSVSATETGTTSTLVLTTQDGSTSGTITITSAGIVIDGVVYPFPAFANIVLPDNTVSASAYDDTVTFAEGPNITITSDPMTKTITWEAAGGSTSFADPTAAVDGTVVNGVATTAMRSDAAPPLADPFTPADGNQNITGELSVSDNIFVAGDPVIQGTVGIVSGKVPVSSGTEGYFLDPTDVTITTNGEIQTSDGTFTGTPSTTRPAYAFTSEPNTGMGLPSANRMTHFIDGSPVYSTVFDGFGPDTNANQYLGGNGTTPTGIYRWLTIFARNLDLDGDVTLTGLSSGTPVSVLALDSSDQVVTTSVPVSTTLQEAYDASTQPQIVTDDTRLSVQFRNGTASNANPVIEVQSDSPATVFSVDGTGLTTTTDLSVANSVNLPGVTSGTPSSILALDASDNIVTTTVSGFGDVDGPASSTDNAVARFDGTTGKIIQNSAVTIADTTGDTTGVGTLTTSGQIGGPSGSAGTPTFSFSGDTNTGIYRSAENILSVATGGTHRYRFNDASGFEPVGSTGIYDLGSSSVRWNDVFAFDGNFSTTVTAGTVFNANATNVEMTGLSFPVADIERQFSFGGGSAAAVGIVANRTSGTWVDGNGPAIAFQVVGSGIGSNTNFGLLALTRDGANTTSKMEFYTATTGTNNLRMLLTSGGNLSIGGATPTALLDVQSDVIRLRTAKTPASAAASGNAGDIAWDTNYIYVCVATNTWKRVAIATW